MAIREIVLVRVPLQTRGSVDAAVAKSHDEGLLPLEEFGPSLVSINRARGANGKSILTS